MCSVVQCAFCVCESFSTAAAASTYRLTLKTEIAPRLPKLAHRFFMYDFLPKMQIDLGDVS